AAQLYIGSSGIMKNALDANMTTAINLSGTLGAAADWATTQGLTLSASTATIQAADASNVAHNITISGAIGGSGGLTKTGAGTLTINSAGRFYTGKTNINGGTLNINSTYLLGGAVYSGATFGGGTLQYATTLLNNATDITQNTAATPAAVPVTINAGGATIDTNGNDVT